MVLNLEAYGLSALHYPLVGIFRLTFTTPLAWLLQVFSGVPRSLYIDDRLNGELLSPSGPWSVLPEHSSKEFRFNAANAALFVVLSVLVGLGYTIGIKKSVLHPTTSLEYLGFVVDSVNQCFLLPRDKIHSWAVLREHILQCKSWVDVKTLQRLQECISFSLAVLAAKLFIREMSSSIGSASLSGRVNLSKSLREELSYWRFLDEWDQFLPWRELFKTSKNHFALAITQIIQG